MRTVISRAKDLIASTDGPTATEYAIMLALIVVVAIAVIASLGTKVSSVFSAVDGTVAAPGGS